MTEHKEGWDGIKELKDTLGVLEMSGRKTIKISDVRYFLEEAPPEL